MARVLLAAAHKSSGKTTLTVGLAAALAGRGLAVQTFKKGPDYIDPMWHAHASGRRCYNLDFNTHTRAEILACAASREGRCDFALIEANKGLHDGLDLDGGDCSAALAKLLSAPVILVIDALGMTRGVAPLVLGYKAFDPGVHIAGVILNKVGAARQQTKLGQALERYTDIPVLGAIPRSKDFAITERHLGLMTPTEAPALAATIARLKAAVEDGVDVDRMLAIGRAAPPLAPTTSDSCPPSSRGAEGARIRELESSKLVKASLLAIQDVICDFGLLRGVYPGLRAGARNDKKQSAGSGMSAGDASALVQKNAPRVRIAVARDSAFGFYYADDLEAFERAGAKLCFFDALSGARLPDADGLFIGGGFPETQAAALSANASLRADIARRLRAGLPAYAECGGLMYLTRSISYRGETHEMVGVVPADAAMHERPQGRGLALLAETAAAPWPSSPGSAAATIPAHEFHYAALENLAPGQRFAYRVERGTGIAEGSDGIVIGNLVASFCHQRASAGNPWVERFVAFVRARREKIVQPHKFCAGAALALHA